MVKIGMGNNFNAYTVCSQVFGTWKRKCAGFLLLFACLNLSLFILHLHHPTARSLHSHQLKDSIHFTSSWFFSDKFLLQNLSLGSNNRRRANGSSTTPKNSRANDLKEINKLIPCNNLVNQIPRGSIMADKMSFPSLRELESSLAPTLQQGGHYIPKNCRSSQRVAIIVPYRDRSIHRNLFLRHMHPFLQRQNLEYYIVFVEQTEGEPFNRALLFNIGYTKMKELHNNIDCFIFHDIDLLPLDDRILYFCHEQPLHLSRIVDTLGTDLMYAELFGGAVALTPAMMDSVNGFPNTYYGWGGEDDDMSYRVRHHGYSIQRYSKDVARYTMMRHVRNNIIDNRELKKKVRKGRERIKEDGLSTLSFQLIEFKLLPLYTWIKITPNMT